MAEFSNYCKVKYQVEHYLRKDYHVKQSTNISNISTYRNIAEANVPVSTVALRH